MIAWIPVLVSAVAGIGGLVYKFYAADREPGAVRSMRRHAALIETLPEDARPSVAALIKQEADLYSKRMLRRGTRKVDGGTVGTIIFIAVVTSGLVYPVTLLALHAWGWWILVVLIAGLGIALILAGSREVYTYGDDAAQS